MYHVHFIIYIYICTYGQVNRLVSYLPHLVAYIHQRPSAVHTRQRSGPHTHTQMAHNIIYTPGTMSTICETPFRPGPARLSKTGKLYDRERGSSAAPTQQQRWLYSSIIYTLVSVCARIRTICASWSHPHHQRIITIIIVTVLLCIHNLII